LAVPSIERHNVEPSFFRDGQPVEHPLEHLLKASGWAILTSIERQRMSVMNVKGQLAEYYLSKELETLLATGKIQEFEWRLESPDFSLMLDNRNFTMECKNVRKTDEKKKDDPWWVELQKTRNSKDGTNTRGYAIHEFELVAVCLFNRTGEWKYWFAATKKLIRRPEDQNLLAIRQTMPLAPGKVWHENVFDAIKDALEGG
jgi:hypothetical protein